MVGDTKMILDAMSNLVPLFNSRNVLLDGDGPEPGASKPNSAVKSWKVGRRTCRLAFADVRYTDYEFNFVEDFAGFAQQARNRTPRTPRLSGNLSTTYTHALTDNMDGFARLDVSYVGKTFVDESNLGFVDDYFLTNIRVGVELEQIRFRSLREQSVQLRQLHHRRPLDRLCGTAQLHQRHVRCASRRRLYRTGQAGSWLPGIVPFLTTQNLRLAT